MRLVVSSKLFIAFDLSLAVMCVDARWRANHSHGMKIAPLPKFAIILINKQIGFCIATYHILSFPDPRVRDMLFMSNPFTMLGILAVYLYFILKWGPQYMKNRKPFNLNRIIIAYNIIQIVACARLVVQVNFIYPFDSCCGKEKNKN